MGQNSLRKPELQKPDWQTRPAKVWRLLRFHNSNVKAAAKESHPREESGLRNTNCFKELAGCLQTGRHSLVH